MLKKADIGVGLYLLFAIVFFFDVAMLATASEKNPHIVKKEEIVYTCCTLKE